jgi:hypothetical protein
MRLKKSNVAACVCVLASVVVLSATAFTAAPALALSEGRVYEMASPVYKGGYGAVLTAVAPDGESVVFSSVGVFAGIQFPEAGAYYLARREAGNGWSTTPVEAPFPPPRSFSDFSSTLAYTLGERSIAAFGESEFLLHLNTTPDIPENWEVFGGIVFGESSTEASASGDLCHVVLDGNGDLLPEPGQQAPIHTLYDLARGCRGEGGSLRQVAVKNRAGSHGEPEPLQPGCRVELGVGTGGGGYVEGPYGAEPQGSFNEVSGDGSEMFFTTGTPDIGNPGHCSHPQLFVRVGGSRTVEVSRRVDPSLPYGGCGEGPVVGEVPGEVPCPGAAERAGAFFKGASEDGSRVLFTSAATLVEGDTDASNKLYVASIGCPETEPGCEPAQRRVTGMVDASRSHIPGEAAEVQGVVSIGRQAGHAYFVAHGVLVGAPNGEEDVAVKGAENLYSYDTQTGDLAFVADLCSGPVQSGAIEDLRCPRDLSSTVNDEKLWGTAGGRGGAEAQSAGDGRYLVFSSYAQLIVRGTQADTDSTRDVYRYDAQTGVLDRVSLGEGGHDANGNNSEFEAKIEPVGINPSGGQFSSVLTEQEMDTRAVSEDGSMVVFSSAEPLSADAINGHENVYIWHEQPGQHEGSVSMISSGNSLTNDVFPVINLTGRDVFFTTSEGLVPQDTEGDLDVYDARIEGGFPQQPVERQQCSSDACQGALTNPAPLLVPGSVSQAAGGNFAAPSKPAVKPKKKAKPKKKTTKKKKGKARKAGRGKRTGRASGKSQKAGNATAGRDQRR